MADQAPGEPNGCTITIAYSDGTSQRWAVGDEYGEALATLLGTTETEES